ncbi:MAG: tetratricopeptide repeat protein [Fibrobacterota bacterium]
MSRLMRWVVIVMAALALSAWAGGVVFVNGKEDRNLDAKMKKGLDLLFRENFSAAIKLFEQVKKDYPDHPVGYFLTAAALDARMYFYLNADQETEFMKNCEKAIELGEALIQKNPKDPWILFFTGGAYGYIGTFQSRYKRYITSFRNGWSGVTLLKQIHEMDNSFVDVLFGLGLYDYWSSKLSKLMWWMPGLGDKREDGINQLKKVVNEGYYTSQPAAANLMWIFITENRQQEAVDIAQRMLQKYPNNRIFSFGLAEAYFFMGQYDKSERLFRYILDISDSEETNNNINTLHCHLFLSRIYEKNKVWHSAMAHCRRGLRYRFSETDDLAAKDYTSELKSTLDRVKANYQPQR